MIKNLLSLIGLLLLITDVSFSQTVSQNEAQVIARNHLLTTGISNLKSARLKRENIHFKAAKTEVENKDTLFYILNDSVNNAFVIVSADQRAWPILGYSTEGTFDENKQPEGFKAMLEQWGREIAYIRNKNLQPDLKVKEQWNQLKSGTINSASTGVEPLVKTAWNQDCNYNEQCPVDNMGSCGHVLTGCVPTAMAQIMKYWNYPDIGKGSATNIHPKYGDLSADFESAPYQWEKMPDRVTQPNIEVARLMYHCGVAARTNYNPMGSDTYNEIALKSLARYFKYAENSNTIEKLNSNINLWINALKDEIDAGKPVYVAGYNKYGIGHAFIIDGYRDALYFHYNWGWGGNSDGFYFMENLQSETIPYNETQVAYLNTCPNELPKGMNGIFTTVSNLNLSANEGSKKIRVISSVNWNAVSDQSWLSLSQKTGSPGATEIVVSAPENAGTATRRATIKITTPEFGVRTVIITQQGMVNVSAGSLQAKLGNRLDTIRYLSLKGVIDARDFKTMRDKMPHLVDVDLKNVTIEKYSGQEGTIDNVFENYTENTIPGYAFNKQRCTSIKQITFPLNLKIIDQNAFYFCRDLTKVVIPSPVEIIKFGAFYSCFSLTTLDLPSTLKTFEGINTNQSLLFEAINVDQANQVYSSSNGVLFDKEKTKILLYPRQKPGINYQIPNTVKTIVEGAFMNNNFLRTIQIPPSVENIEYMAFMNCNVIPVADEKSPYFYTSDSVLFNKDVTRTVLCSKLKRGIYKISTTIRSIGLYSFANTRLDSIIIPNTVTTIEPGAFLGSSIKHLVIPSSVTSIGYNSFSFCLQLKSVVIPKSVKSIELAAFASNTECKIIKITCLNSIPPTLGEGVFSYVDKVKCILHVPASSKTAYQAADQWKDFVNIVEMPNEAPVANAGSDQSINEGNSVSLDGSASTDIDGNTLTYKWTAPSGISLSSTTVAKPTFTAPEVTANTNYTFSLVVNDGTVDSPVDQVVITVKNVNKTPIANAGVDQTIDEGTFVSLDGSASSDPEGSSITYLWTAPAGITLSSVSSAKPTFIAPEVLANQTYTFSLIVSDGTASSASDQIAVAIRQVNKVPLANAGVDQTIDEGTFVSLDGSTSSDPDGNSITYLWTAPAGIILGSASSAKPTFVAPEVLANQTYTFSLIVSDGTANSTSDQIVVTVRQVNKVPLANAGIDQTIDEGTLVSLDGSASSDPEGSSITYLWTAPTGITLSSASSAKPTFTAPEVLANKTYTFSLIVSDETASSASDQIVVTVRQVNKAPTANARADQTVNEGSIVTLDGSLSSDPDGQSLTYSWIAPAGITLSSASSAKPTFIAPEVNADTKFSFTLVVNDGISNSQMDQVVITILQVIKVGVDLPESPEFKIFPNPTSGLTKIDVPGGKSQSVKVSIYNMQGKEIFSESNCEDNYLIDFTPFEDGVYLLKIRTEDKVYSAKVIHRR